MLTKALRGRYSVLLWMPFFLACGETVRAGGVRGILRIELTAAPSGSDSIARADIFVLRVEGMQRDIDSTEAARAPDATTNTDPEAGFVTLATPNVSYNMLELAGGATTELTTTELLIGSYLGFRVILDPVQSSITLSNGTVLRGNTTPGIQWPDPSRVGVKLRLDGPVTVDDVSTTTFLLDFDLRRAFVAQAGNTPQNGVRFTSYVRGAMRDSTGSIEGSIRQDSTTGAAVSNATIEVLQANTAVDDTDPAKIIRSGVSGSSGGFAIPFLAPGTYAVRAVPPPSLAIYRPAIISIVTVASGARSDGNRLVLTR